MCRRRASTVWFPVSAAFVHLSHRTWSATLILSDDFGYGDSGPYGGGGRQRTAQHDVQRALRTAAPEQRTLRTAPGAQRVGYPPAMALDQDPSASTRRVFIRAALLLLPLLCAAAGAPFLLRHLRGAPVEVPSRESQPTGEEIAASARADLELARTVRRTWEGATYLAPAAARRDDSGEVTSRFEGFGISVETEPVGVRVVVDGADVGETPLVASVKCAIGGAVRVRLERPPLRPQERTTTCRENTLVEISAKLSR